jgi:hypothetical protein
MELRGWAGVGDKNESVIIESRNKIMEMGDHSWHMADGAPRRVWDLLGRVLVLFLGTNMPNPIQVSNTPPHLRI